MTYDRDAGLDESADREELKAFLRKVEAGEFDRRGDPGFGAAVRIARALLEDDDLGGDT